MTDKPWPSRFGLLGEKIFGSDDPFNIPINTRADYLFTSDEMPPTKHPITGEYFTSKKAFRQVTRSHNYEEVGTAYDNGYQPEKEREYSFNKMLERVGHKFRDRIRNG